MALEREDESKFESRVLGWLSENGWQAHHSDNDSWGGKKLDKEYGRTDTDVMYHDILEKKLIELNDYITEDNVKKVRKEIQKITRSQEGILPPNKEFHGILHRGIDIDFGGDLGTKTVTVLDLDRPSRNRFDAVSQFSFVQDYESVRPDVVLLINGIPIVICELKSRAQSNDYKSAINDLKSYEENTPRMFRTSLLNIAATQNTFKYGSPTSAEKYYVDWKPEDIIGMGETPGDSGYDVETCFKSLCEPSRLLEIIEDFVFYDLDGSKRVKAVPRHPQYFAVKRILERTEKALEIDKQARGLVWHTQGSGKSYAMYYASRYCKRRRGAKPVIVVDRDDLRTQVGRELTRISPGFSTEHGAGVTVAESKKELESELQSSSTDIVLTTIQLFEDIDSRLQSADMEVFVFADEAHREMEGLYGTKLDLAIPDAHHFGFTGTPVQDSNKRNTFENYAMEEFDSEEEPYIHRYSMKEGCEEGVITEVDVISRTDVLQWEIYEEELDSGFIDEYSHLSQSELREKAVEELTSTQLAEINSRIAALAEDIATHYHENVESEGLKGMVVAPSRFGAARYAEHLLEYFDEDEVEVLYTKDEGDGELLNEFYTKPSDRETITETFDNTENPKLLIVCDMLLTGFDAPTLKTIYLDRHLTDHNLMQAIARTNRPHASKPFGQIVDYRGVTEDLDKMYSSIEDDLTVYLAEDKDNFLEEYKRKLESLEEMVDDENIQNTVEAADYILQDIHSGEQFKTVFQEARDLRSAIQPDKRLSKFEEEFAAYKEIYKIINPPDYGGPTPEQIRELLEQGVDVRRNNDVNGKEITVNEWQPMNIKVTKKYQQLEDILGTRRAQNPAFKDLSERVEDIIRRWNQSIITSEEATEELDSVEEELQERPTPETTPEKEWLEYVVRGVLKEKTDMNENENEKIVSLVVEQFTEKWPEVERMKRDEQLAEIARTIQFALLTHAQETAELATSEFPREVADYLLRNVD